jgi:hypothetical protein
MSANFIRVMGTGKVIVELVIENIKSAVYAKST